MDPQVKIFMDEARIEIEPEWGLPIPNAEAAYKSLAKYAKPWINLTPERVRKLNKAYDWMKRHFGIYMRDSRVLTLEEAVNHMDMSTSSGVPFNEEFNTKGELFDGDPDIIQWLEDDWKVLAEDPNWTAPFTSSLKEELRTVEKIANNSIRTFAAGATDMTTHGTRLFVDMNEKMHESYLVSSSVIGMSPLKGNWNRLYEKLRVFKNGYALDETAYDSSLRDFLMWGCARYRWECLCEEHRTPGNKLRIKTYYRNLIHTVLLTSHGILVMKKGGQPSGSVNTVTDNTLILYWLLAYAWIDQTPEEWHTLQTFEEHTSKALLGDDNTWTVSDAAHEYYNAYTVIDSFKTLGVITTTDSMEPRRVEDLDFLSAHTVFIGGRAVPLYSRNKLMQSLLFADSKHLTPETTLTRVCCILQIGWTDLPLRKYCRELINFLLQKYDKVLANDQRWIIAKCNIKDDEFYYRLVVGTKDGLLLHPQSYEESKERSEMPHKQAIMSVVIKPIENRKPRRGRNGRRGGKKTQVTVQKPQAQATSKQGRRRARRKRAGRPRLTNRQPSTQGGFMSRRSCVVQEDEYIGEVLVANQPAFNVVSYPLNPGQSSTFPWLSQQAKQWEKYEFEMLDFYFKREVSEFNTAGSAGKIIMSVDYDAADAPPTTKQQMEDTYQHRDCMPSENVGMPLDRKDLKTLAANGTSARYVRPGGLPGAADIRLYDIGNLFIATQGIPANVNIGELHVRYRVKFSVPVLESTLAAPRNNSVSWYETESAETFTNGIAATVQGMTMQSNGLGITDATGEFTLSAGNYLVDYSFLAFDSGTETFEALMHLEYASTQIGLTYHENMPSMATPKINVCGQAFIAIDGTGTLKLVVQLNGSSGTLTGFGSLRIVAI